MRDICFGLRRPSLLDHLVLEWTKTRAMPWWAWQSLQGCAVLQKRGCQLGCHSQLPPRKLFFSCRNLSKIQQRDTPYLLYLVYSFSYAHTHTVATKTFKNCHKNCQPGEVAKATAPQRQAGRLGGQAGLCAGTDDLRIGERLVTGADDQILCMDLICHPISPTRYTLKLLLP